MNTLHFYESGSAAEAADVKKGAPRQGADLTGGELADMLYDHLADEFDALGIEDADERAKAVDAACRGYRCHAFE